MKKFWLITIVATLSLAIPFFLHSPKAYAVCGDRNGPPYLIEHCGLPNPPNPGYWLPYCANPTFNQFDRCPNQSFYNNQEQKVGFFENARWIWQFGHQGNYPGYPDISSAEGNGTPGDLTGFVNVIRQSLDWATSTQAAWAYNYLRTGIADGAPGHCNEVDHVAPTGQDLNPFIWCEIDSAAMIGASQIINNMMGLGGNNRAFDTNGAGRVAYINICGSPANWSNTDRRLNGINVARCLFTQWRNVIDYYDTQPKDGSSTNGYVLWDDVPNLSACRTDAVVYRDVLGYDVADYRKLDTGAFVNCAPDSSSHYITFHNPDKSVAFRINKNCGNLTGPLKTLSLNAIFHITPSLSTSVSPTTENVQSVTFTTGYSLDADISLSTLTVSIVRSYYIQKFNGPKINFRPDIPTPRSGVQLRNGLHSFPNYIVDSSSSPPLSSYSPSAGDQICQSMTITPNTGKYNFQTHLVSNLSTVSFPPSCVTVIDQPYSKFFNGDVYVGGGFQDPNGCGPVSGDIKMNKSPFNNAGSSSQFATSAMGTISGYTTANLGTVAPAKAPKGLTFANSPGATSGTFGSASCYPNYWGSGISLAPDIPGNTITVGAGSVAASGAHKTNALAPGLVINGGNVAVGKQFVIYVNGSVRITNDIKYAGINGGGIPENQIPSLMIIAKDNIYIDPGVTQLDGIYIAQGYSGGGAVGTGTIYTCDNGGFGAYAEPPVATVPFITGGGACNNQKLTVNGTFVARDVKLERTKNSIRNDSGDRYNTSNAAETFIMSPEIYAGIPALCSGVPGLCVSGIYDAVTSLPPIL